MIEELGVRLRADGVVQATNGVDLTGKAVENLGKKADAAAPAMARVGKSAKETAAAMRLLPAQITDITTSLASGQPAWLVAIQQGGQIKDSFGGIGPAATAMRAALSPLSLALGGTAVAMGAVIAAYVVGQREADGYRRAIVLTGNAAGVSADQMSDMAAAIDDVAGTQHDAADALAQLVASGQVGQRGLQQFAETAVRMERVTGQSIEDTVKAFADLGRAPLQASVRLNESMNYLTSATYNHIRSLVEQKKMSEAASVAQQAYADAMKPRLAQLEGNLGTLQRAWRGVKSLAAEAWDAMLGIGREDSVAQQIKAAQASLDALDSRKSQNPALTAQRREAIVARIEGLRELQRMQERSAATSAAEAASVKDEIAAADGKKRGIDQAASAYANLHDQIARRQSQAQAEIDNEGKLGEAERFRVDMLREIAEAQGKIGAASANRLRAEVDATARTIANLELQRQAASEQEEIRKRFVAERQQAADAAARETDQIRQVNEALASETDELGLNAQALYARRQAMLQNTIADKQARLERISGLPAYAEEAAALEQQIELLRQRAGLAAGKYAKEQATEEAKANQERTDAIAASIEEGVINGFRDGRSASAAFLREIQAQFLRAALKLPIQVMAQTGSDLMGGALNLLKLLPGLVGGGGGGIMGNDIALGYHGGGVGAGEASFRRSVPRFHGGTGPGELPAIIKSDEGVFTKGQMRAMAPVADVARAAGPALTFAPVINIDSRTDKAEIAGLVGRAMRVAQADLLDKMRRKQV